METILIILYCFCCKKEQKMHIKKEQLRKLHCPNCGSKEACIKVI